MVWMSGGKKKTTSTLKNTLLNDKRLMLYAYYHYQNHTFAPATPPPPPQPAEPVSHVTHGILYLETWVFKRQGLPDALTSVVQILSQSLCDAMDLLKWKTQSMHWERKQITAGVKLLSIKTSDVRPPRQLFLRPLFLNRFIICLCNHHNFQTTYKVLLDIRRCPPPPNSPPPIILGGAWKWDSRK